MTEPTPSHVALFKGMRSDPAYRADIIKAYEQGRREGMQESHSHVIDFLSEHYMSSKVKRNSPDGKAILRIATALSEDVQKQIKDARDKEADQS